MTTIAWLIISACVGYTGGRIASGINKLIGVVE